MTLASLILLSLKISIVLNVFGLGLRTTLAEVTYLVRQPGVLVRSIFSLFAVMPVVAVAMALLFDLKPAVKIALVALAMSPVPPLLPKRQFQAGGHRDYAISLLATASVLATIVVPLILRLVGGIFRLPLQLSPGAVALLMLKALLAPLAVGIVVRLAAPRLSERAAGPIVTSAMVLLLLSVLPVVFTMRGAILSLFGDGTLLAIVAFTVIGLAVGHLLGGPGREHRAVLALSTASRHPGMAAAIAQANFPQQRSALAAIVLFLIVNMIVSAPYVSWSKRSAAHRSADDWKGTKAA